MPTPIETVTAFLEQCAQGKAPMHDAFRRYFTPATVYENVGFSKTTGLDEAMAVINGFEATIGASSFRAEMLSIACDGNRVLTERIDYLVDSAGKDIRSLQLMGIFEVADGKITAWRDYFDTAGFAAGN